MEIMQYLEEHPRSKDTMEGIRTWWLENRTVPVPTSRVEKALNWLIKNHAVVKETLPDGGAVFASTNNEISKSNATH